MLNKYKTLLSNTAIFAFSNVLSKIILSLLLPLYTRTLTQSEYGTIELITTIAQLLYPAMSLSIQDATFRYALDNTKNKEQVFANSLLIILIGVFAFVPVSFALKYYHGIGNFSIYFYFFAVLSMIRSMLSLYVKGIGKTKIFSVDVVAYNALLAINNVVFLIGFRMKIEGYFYSVFLSQFFSILYLGYHSNSFHIQVLKINYELLKEMIMYSSPLILNSISWGLTHAVDRIMLTNMIGSEANGIYSVASKIPSLLSLMTSMFTQAWTISLIQDYQGERDKRFYNNVFMATHICCLVVTATMLLFNNNLIPWLLGDTFSEASRYVPILLLGTLFLTYSNFFTPFFAAEKKSVLTMLTAFIGAIFNVIFNYLLIPRFGIMGACIATTGSYICISILRVVIGLRIQTIAIQTYKFVISLVSISICAVFVSERYYGTIAVLVLIIICIYLYWDYFCKLFSYSFKSIGFFRSF